MPQWRALRAHAAAEGRSVSAIVVEALGPLLRSAAVDSAAPTDAD